MSRVFTSSKLKDPKHTPLDAKCEACDQPFGHHGAIGNNCPSETTMLLRKTLAEEGRPVDDVNATEVHTRQMEQLAPVIEHMREGIKFDQDKPRMDLIDPTAMNELAKVLAFGAQKYAAHNWRKGLHKSRLLGAALRHLFAYLGGEDKDPETGLSHVAHAMCCCMFLIGLEHRADLDDRYKEAANG